MKGQILGFDGAKGAITGEDGNRYSFELAEGRGKKHPNRATVSILSPPTA